VLGVLSLPADGVLRVGPTDAPVDVAAEPPAELIEADPGVFGSGWLIDFEREFTLGVSGARGNSSNLDASAGVRLDFEDDTKRWNFDLRYYYAESGGDATKDQGYLDLTRDWLIPGERHFYFGQLRWDIDDFEAWDHRGSLGGGIGWNLIASETFDLRARTGLAVTRTFGGLVEDTDLEWLIRLETDWQPTAYQTVTAYNALYPSITDTGDFRNLTGITWKIDFAESEGLALQFGVENEYESNVPRGTDRNDLQYNASLVVDF
jgi:putative salt-induced outer membrane protein